MKVKVQNEVTQGKCGSCMRAWIREDSEHNVTVVCHAMYEHPQIITQPITRCTLYHERNRKENIDNMTKIALMINVNSHGKTAGFHLPPDESRDFDE